MPGSDLCTCTEGGPVRFFVGRWSCTHVFVFFFQTVFPMFFEQCTEVFECFSILFLFCFFVTHLLKISWRFFPWFLTVSLAIWIITCFLVLEAWAWGAVHDAPCFSLASSIDQLQTSLLAVYLWHCENFVFVSLSSFLMKNYPVHSRRLLYAEGRHRYVRLELFWFRSILGKIWLWVETAWVASLGWYGHPMAVVYYFEG